MNRILSNLVFILLLLTLAVACQKDEITQIKPTDTLEARTLEFDIPTLWIIHNDLRTEVIALIDQGVLNPPNGNGLIPQLNNLKRAIENAEDAETDPIEANQMLEEDIIPHLAGLLDDGVLTEEQYDALYNIATNAPLDHGTVTLGGVDYQWKLMADGKKWLVENLRYPTFDEEGVATSWFYPGTDENGPYGRLYTQAGASAACEALAAVENGWHLPNRDVEWWDLAASEGSDWLEPQNQNYGAYQALLDPIYTSNPDASGFNALLGGQRRPHYVWDPVLQQPVQQGWDFTSLGSQGYYWSSQSGKCVYFIKTPTEGYLQAAAYVEIENAFSCRCVCNVE